MIIKCLQYEKQNSSGIQWQKSQTKDLPNDQEWVLYSHPTSQHATVRSSKHYHRALFAIRVASTGFQPSQELRVVGQSQLS